MFIGGGAAAETNNLGAGWHVLVDPQSRVPMRDLAPVVCLLLRPASRSSTSHLQLTLIKLTLNNNNNNKRLVTLAELIS